MKVNGSCHCGQIKYQAEVDPEKAYLCHCRDCQMLSGTAYRASVAAPSNTFRLLSGKPRDYIKTAESGRKRIQAFCPDCGTPIYSTAIENTPVYILRLGCLEQKDMIKLEKQIWCKDAFKWSMTLEQIPQIEKQ
jgi:hypothetical protein